MRIRTVKILLIVTAMTFLIVGKLYSDDESKLSDTSAIPAIHPHSDENDELRRDAGQSIEMGRRMTIQSKVLKQEREYLVFLPPSYHENRYLPKSYPVLFLFDGDVQFHLISGMVEQMGGLGGQIPEMIVVGI
ncbi:MAG: hypothetical protein AAGA30_20050, partial [Planctomycetota bacterium]